ncbi:MAG: hypothetical protein AAGI01_07990 [Myxococcota bacterium]
MLRHRFAAFLGFLAIGSFSAPAVAAEFTDLLDAADDFDDLDPDTSDSFDFSIEPSFSFMFTTGRVLREAPCVTGDEYDASTSELVRDNPRLVIDRDGSRCPESRRTVYNREMSYTSSRAQLDINVRAGLYKDLELRVNVPYVFVNSRRLGYDDADPRRAVRPSNSSVDPVLENCSNDDGRCIEREALQTFEPGQSPGQQINAFDQYQGYRYFALAREEEIVRSGFAEPSVGLHWSVFNDARDDTKANLLLGFDYTMPIVPIQQRTNDAIGRGLHQLDFKLASSKQFDWIEPYFGVQYSLPIASTRSPIREVDPSNSGQVFTNAPMSGEITFGTEFIPFEDLQQGRRYGIDLRFTFGYVSEGRDYSPIFDHLASSNCNGKTLNRTLPRFTPDGVLSNPGDVACHWITRQPSNASGSPIYDLGAAVDDPDQLNREFFSDGITTVESYGTFQGLLGIYMQPSPNLQLKALTTLQAQQGHFLTNARTGRDTEGEAIEDETVDLEGIDSARERNPVYNTTLDSAGERFRVQALTTWTFMITAALQF